MPPLTWLLACCRFIARCDPADTWLGPTICLLKPSEGKPELTLLGRLYTGRLSSTDVQALRNAPSIPYELPPEDRYKTWSALCGNCTDPEATEIVQLESRRVQAAAVKHCRACGYASVEGWYDQEDLNGPRGQTPQPALQIEKPSYGSSGNAPIPG